MNSYVADELRNKLYHAHKALQQAEKIIKALEEQNKYLKEILEQRNIDEPVGA